VNNITSITGAGQVESDTTMSLVELCMEGDLEGVKAALQSGADVNTKSEHVWNDGWTGLMKAVFLKNNSVVALLLNTPNIDVNQKDNKGACALHWAVEFEQLNEVLKLLLNCPSIDVNIVDRHGWSAVFRAVYGDNIEAVKLLLNVPTIDVNIMDIGGCGVVHWAVEASYDIEGLKLLLSHPNLTALTLNQKENENGGTPVMWAVKMNRWKHLKLLLNVPSIDVNIVDNAGHSAVYWAVGVDNIEYREEYKEEDIEGLKLLLSHPSLTSLTLNQKDNENGDTPVMLAMKKNGVRSLMVVKVLAADPRVDLDTTDKEGMSLAYLEHGILSKCDRPVTDGVVYQARQRREKRRRLIREQQRQVSKVLLDGLYDPDSPISKLLGVRTEVVGEIIWQKLVENWQIFPEHMLWC